MEYGPVTPSPKAISQGVIKLSDEKPFSILGFQPFGEDGPTFYDMLDIVNPLQHLPIVSYFYREFTEDTIEPLPRVAGGALFGGLYGAVASLVNVVVDEVTGDDIGGHAIAAFKDLTGIGDDPEQPTVQHANAADPGSLQTEVDIAANHLAILRWSQQEMAWRDAAAQGDLAIMAATSVSDDLAPNGSPPNNRSERLSLLHPPVADQHQRLDIHA